MKRHDLIFVHDVLKQSVEEYDFMQDIGIDIYDLWLDALDVVSSELERVDGEDSDI